MTAVYDDGITPFELIAAVGVFGLMFYFFYSFGNLVAEFARI